MYHIRKNARYRKMESIFAIKKKMEGFGQKLLFRGLVWSGTLRKIQLSDMH